MRILLSVHLYPPAHNCGGEYYLHNMAKWLISRGHEIRVMLHQGMNYGITEIYEYQGVTVFPHKKNSMVWFELVRWCEIAITHLEYTGTTIEACRVWKKPVVQVVHNDTPYEVVQCSYKPMNIIYNSQWIADKLQYKWPSMVMTPPVDWRRFDQPGNPNDRPYITLINCNDNKGGKTLTKIAKAMPERMFLAVKGSYEDQFQFVDDLPNIHKMDNTPNILPIYAMTRILLMPSKYESWGMTATEAMAGGIPVICTKTPGLLENTGGKMLYCGRDAIADWVKKIKSLDKPTTYDKYSEAGRARAKELDPLPMYEKLEKFLHVAI